MSTACKAADELVLNNAEASAVIIADFMMNVFLKVYMQIYIMQWWGWE